MKRWSQEANLAAWNFAAHKHRNQKVPGADTPYAAHLEHQYHDRFLIENEAAV